MHEIKNIGVIMLVAMLAACTDTTPPASPPMAKSATLRVFVPRTAEQPETLMMAVFGAQYRSKTRDALVQLDNPYGEVKTRFLVEAIRHTTLPTGETVLLARTRYADPAAVEHVGKTRWLGVYFLRKDKGKWSVIRRHDNLTLLDQDSLGTAAWINLGKGKQGIAVTATSRWDACADTAVTLFDLGDPLLSRLNEPIAIESNAAGEECNRFYEGSRWSAKGQWRMVPPKTLSPYDDLVMTFSGHMSTLRQDDQAGPRIKTNVDGSARYVYDAELKQYQLAEGKNPIPQVPEDDQG